MKAKEDLAFKIKDIVEKKAKALFVSQTAAPLYIQNFSDERAEQFAPQELKNKNLIKSA